MTSPDLITAAEAYRVERARYWVRRLKIGESVTPGGTVETYATQILNHDKSFGAVLRALNPRRRPGSIRRA